MKHATKTLLAALLITACPVMAQDDTAEAEAETEIEIINGIPVNPELKKLIMESEEKLSVQELIEMSSKVMQEQADEAAAAAAAADREWLQGDPLGTLEEEMYELVQDIDESDTDEQTQAQGEEVVRKMDTLIAMLEKASSACSSCSGGGSKPGNGPANGNQPAPDSTLAAGPGGSGELGASGEGNNRFEDLDPAQREAILRANEENQGLPAEFDALLAEYYQRLAAERALTAEDDEAGDE
ncbi:MAG: hypothetical protein KTR15_02640 [Phycisphaeraceae bacterium]|nr:hypothetical protein [Phycisphaeraceae bacterium]